MDTRDLTDLPLPPGVSLGSYLKNKNRIAVSLRVVKGKHKLPVSADKGEFLYGLKTDLLASHENYRGRGLAPQLYASLAKAGQVLFSSTYQTGGGKKTWLKVVDLVKSQGGEVVVFIMQGSADDFLKRYQKKYKTANNIKTLNATDSLKHKIDGVIVFGPLTELEKIAYSMYDAFWIVGPAGTFDRFKEMALNVK